ncbi:hypothetical protein DITRI_Ditri13aG0099800 [Diplodiscus trichospermus]
MKCLHLFLATAAVFFLVSNHACEVAASRVLNEDVLVLQSLPKGPVSPSGHSSCTNIPGRHVPPCTSERTFAGHVMASPRRLEPDRKVPFSAAANLK